MVGPDFHTPAAPSVKTYTESPLPRKTVSIAAAGKAGRTQYFIAGRDIPAEWWALFHSPQLNQLIERGIANSPNLAAAEAALRQARENLNAQIGLNYFPAITGSLSGERETTNAAATGSTNQSIGVGAGTTNNQSTSTGGVVSNQNQIFNLYNASVGVSYTVDVFGGLRRQIEGLRAQVDNQRYQLLAAYLTLTANIVTTSVTTASLQAQIQATHELIDIQQENLAIVEQQFRLGGASQANVLTQQNQLAQTRATLPPLQKSLAQSRDSLAVLIGAFPSDSQLPKFNLATLNLPTHLPVSLPSSLVRQRPDVLASEATLHAASAQIGVATANMLPQITLNASYGWAALVPGGLFKDSSKAWSYGAGLTQPIFEGGALLAKRRAAIAAYDQAAAQYKQTVLQAFQNVADTLRALETDARTLRDQKQAEIAARASLVLTRDQYRLGGVSYLSLLTAEQQYQQARINRIQAQATRYADTAALFQALGGGWWNQNKKGFMQ